MLTARGSLSKANLCLLNLNQNSVSSWSTCIAAHAKLGQYDEVINLYHRMQKSSMGLDGYVFVAVLKACSLMLSLNEGRTIHGHTVRTGFDLDVYVASAVILLYAKCGSLDDMCTVFDKLMAKNVVTWNTVISGYVQHGQGHNAFQLLCQMHLEGLHPDNVTYVCILKACSSIVSLEKGRLINVYVYERGFESDIFVGSILVDMFAKCGSFQDAHEVFNRLLHRNNVTWTSMIFGCARHGNGEKAFQLFHQMQKEGFEVDKATFSCILTACSGVAALARGNLIYAHIIGKAFESDLFVCNTLIRMYIKCGSLEDAYRVFDRLQERDVVAWSAIITGLAQGGYGWKALHLFHRMQVEAMELDKVAFICILKACSSILALDEGTLIHGNIIELGLDSDAAVTSTLMDMYINCGSLEDAQRGFHRMQNPFVVMWTAMIEGYILDGQCEKALDLFHQMQQGGLEPDKVTYLCILRACSSMVALNHGKSIHADLIIKCLNMDLAIGNTLIDMYIKCESVEDALKVFETLPVQDMITWSAMIAGFSQCADYELAHKYFTDMQEVGFKPNDVTFVSLLSACSHMGLLDEGCKHFRSMTQDHGIAPTIEHYNCLVDLLGHAGDLNKAEDVLMTMPFQYNILGWMSLLGCCGIHGNLELGRQCFNQVIQSDPENAGAYVILSNMCAHVGIWEYVPKIEGLRDHADMWKKPGQALIEVGNKVHNLIVGDRSHPQSKFMYGKLNRLNVQMSEEGYMQCFNLVLLSA